MRRALLMILALTVATTGLAATSFCPDRTGMLWRADGSSNGLTLTGERDGVVIVQTTLPFALGMSGTIDSNIKLIADDTTGKVAVVWQRNWSTDLSEIMLAIWNRETWERVEHLTQDFSTNPRFPTVLLSQVQTTVPDPEKPTDANAAITVDDSFLHVLWWDGTERSQHASYALVRLTANVEDKDGLLVRNLDALLPLGPACEAGTAQSALEHPQFAASSARDRALLFFASQRSCTLRLVEVAFTLIESPAKGTPGSVIPVNAVRRRHAPIFGLTRTFQSQEVLSMEGARVVVGNDLRPVVYSVQGDHVDYVVATQAQWSLRRTLQLSNELTLDQAIPLLENLAR